MSDLEKKVMEEKMFSFSIKDLKWVITSAVFGIGLIITIILWIKDRGKVDSLNTKVTTLTEENIKLENEISKLNGQMEGVNHATEVFMKNSPAENRFRIELLEGRVTNLEKPGSNPAPVIPALDSSNVLLRDV